MSDGSDIQPQKVGGVEKIVLRHNLKEVWLLIPDGVEVLVVPDPLLRVLPLLLGPLVRRQHVVHHCLKSKPLLLHICRGQTFSWVSCLV